MPIVDNIKNIARKAVEKRPTAGDIHRRLTGRQPRAFRFADDGATPNHPKWPLLVYKKAMSATGEDFKSGAVLDNLFASHGWGRSWRASVYDFLHYHSQTHEVLGVASGWARLQLGGVKGRMMKVAAGDILVLPAGTGHQLFESSKEFLVVGAYPPEGTYDECTDTRDRAGAAKRIVKTAKPKTDPVLGRRGPLVRSWKR